MSWWVRIAGDTVDYDGDAPEPDETSHPEQPRGGDGNPEPTPPRGDQERQR